jgi:diguanylate cyclase (GGDEF)-like protein
MTASLRSDDTAARLGGDEFVVILESVNKREDAGAIAEKLLSAVSETYFIDGIQTAISASVGIALHPEHGGDVETLINRADQALYEVKAQGANAYRFFPSES